MMYAEDNLRKTDITLVLKPIDGSPKNVHGIIDRGLFTGNNNLHAIMDDQTCFWKVAYENGKLPGGLKDQQFTSYSKLMSYVTTYFKERNIEIAEVRD